MNILICGSRNWEHVTQYSDIVYRAVGRCYSKGYSVVVGDAVGVDSLVAAQCHAQGVPYTVYGLSSFPRNRTAFGAGLCDYRQLDVNSYTERDQVMVQQAGFVYCIWNGKSKGTFAVYAYAKEMGVDCHLWQPVR